MPLSAAVNGGESSIWPDYRGASIVNLMSSLLLGLGGRSTLYPDLHLLPAETVAQADHVVLLIIDGLGYHQLQRQGNALKFYLQGFITSVFPTSTAPAITTLMTGVAPQQHGVTGWFMYLKELGTIATILPFRPRWGDVCFTTAEVNPAALLGGSPITTQMDAECFYVLPKKLVNSPYSVACAGPARRLGYGDWRGCLSRVAELVKGSSSQRRYIYAYWPELDTLNHRHGVKSREASIHLRQLEQGVINLFKALQDTQTLVIVTADHGFIDTASHLTVPLAHHPELDACLAVPLCGEPRAAYCYLRPHKVTQFEDYVHERLGNHCTLHPSAEALAEGWFGSGVPDPRLQDRIGDYLLVTRGQHTIKDVLSTEAPWTDIGVHGGVSADEMYVPLVVARC